MNNSDQNDFNNWQNGDENDMNNPNNWNTNGGFFYYGPASEGFKKLWEQMQDKNNHIENMKEYMNVNDIFEKLSKNNQKNKKSFNKPNRQKQTIFSQDDYLKLIEIRGYLAITEQFAHVKALDKLLNQIQIIPKDTK